MAVTSKQYAICDTEAEIALLTPVAGQKAVALDTGNKFIADGATFAIDASEPKGATGGDLTGSYPSPKISFVALMKWI